MLWNFSQIADLIINNKKERLLIEGALGRERSSKSNRLWRFVLNSHPEVFEINAEILG